MYLSDSPSLLHCSHRLSDLQSEIYSQHLPSNILVISISCNYFQKRTYLLAASETFPFEEVICPIAWIDYLRSGRVYNVLPLCTSRCTITVKPVRWLEGIEPSSSEPQSEVLPLNYNHSHSYGNWTRVASVKGM